MPEGRRAQLGGWSFIVTRIVSPIPLDTAVFGTATRAAISGFTTSIAGLARSLTLRRVSASQLRVRLGARGMTLVDARRGT